MSARIHRRPSLLRLLPLVLLMAPLFLQAQGVDKQMRAKADALFDKGSYAKALPMYSQLVSLSPGDHDLNYKLGACTLYGGEDKEKAIGYLKFAVKAPDVPALAWYFLGRACHLDYRFEEAVAAYEHFRGTADKRVLARFPVDAMEQQCRNGKDLLNNIKDITVYNKVEVDASEFFRFYDLSDIGGKIVVTPEELTSSMDRKSGERSLVYLPNGGGPIYFSSYGKDGKTGRDIYRTELLPNGHFKEPVKLAGYINTGQDEAFAVMAPNGKDFYFCSKGHNSMGGYDVFKSTYDKGMDVFGPPENMDFAVNTPADEMLYIVGPDGKEACFASNRGSKQGMMDVYRVGTDQAPVNITVLKGTYASAFDPNDRKAHIVVKDGITHEQVADVRTDINGAYLLVIPKGGKYDFFVEGGPSGQTHLGTVDVPPSKAPSAYRQETQLVNQGGEKLVIKTYFDQPLQEDVMALAMKEIKRRAQLDVTGAAGPATATATTAEGLTATAGFSGDMTVDRAEGLARQDADQLADLAKEQARQAQVAYALARRNMGSAETESEKAAGLVGQAQSARDEAGKNEMMHQAVGARQRSREANDRARVAFAAANELELAGKAGTQRATDAAALASALTQAVCANDTAASVNALKRLKARIDAKNGPNGGIDDAERMRRAATEAGNAAARSLSTANAQRSDETGLLDRINHVKNEVAGAKGHKKDDLSKVLARLEQQYDAMKEETDAAFSKAKQAEAAAALARGQASLAAYLKHTDTTAARSMTPDEIAAFPQRVAKVGSANSSLAIDVSYDLTASEPAEATERRTFDWGGLAQPEGEGSGTVATTARTGTAVVSQATITADTLAMAGSRGQIGGTAQTVHGADDDQGAPEASKASRPNSGGQQPDQVATVSQDSIAPSPNETQPLLTASTNDGRVVTPFDSISMADHAGADSTQALNRDEQAFFMANHIAELTQLRKGAKGRKERDSLDTAIAAQRQRMSALQTGGAEPKAGGEGMHYTALSFDPTVLDEQLAEDISPGFTLRRKQIEQGNLGAKDKAISLHALEMQLVDSIDARTAEETAYLAGHPKESDKVLPQINRLREFKAKHIAQANKDLAGQDMRYAATETHAMEDALLDSASAGRPAAEAPVQRSSTPHNDAYVSVAPDTLNIYESIVAYRSPDVKEALKLKEGDLRKCATLQGKVDSMEAELEGMPAGKSYDKLRKRTDRTIDDILITKTDMGQRMAFISKKEYKAARDSAEGLQKSVDRMGLPMDAPLVQMAASLDKSAADAMDQAGSLRKKADRTEDIIQRNTYYRRAYAEELDALRELDRSNTVRNYLLQGKGKPDEALTYAEVERRMFPEAATPLAWNDDTVNGTVASSRPASEAADTARKTPRPGELPGAIGEIHSAVPETSTVVADTVASVAGPVEGAESGGARTGAETRLQAALPDSMPGVNPSADEQTLKGYLDRYYYLNPDERSSVLTGRDRNRYFTMKGAALDQRARSDEATEAANGSTKLAAELENEARERLKPGTDGTVGADQREQAQKLNYRADALKARSDSLRDLSARLLQAASLSDAQAAAFMQTLPTDSSASIMGLEQAGRRTEPLLARIRPIDNTIDSVPTSRPDTAIIPEIQSSPLRETAALATDTAPPVDRHADELPGRLNTRSINNAPKVFTGPLTEDVFRIEASAPPRQTAIPVDVPMPKGIVFKVQVGAFRNPLPVEAFSDMSPVVGEHAGNGLTRYTAGLFTSAESAANAGEKIRSRGYHDAFVVAYQDGRRIPLREAMRLEAAPATGNQAETAAVPAAEPAENVGTTHILAPGGTGAAAVLAKYPATAAAVLAQFDTARSSVNYYNVPGAAPAKQVETVKGLFFTVQVGVYSKPTPLDRLFNITPLNSERTEKGKIRYTTGMFNSVEQASTRKDTTVRLGVIDAFVTAYLNGSRIPLRDARALLAKFGPAVLAQPGTGTR